MKSNYRCISAAAFVIAVVVFGAFVGRSSIVSPRVSASDAAFRGGALPEMLAYALDFARASDLELFGSNAIRNAAGAPFSAAAIDRQVARDLEKAYSAIAQLPCENLDSSVLSDRTFGPGVYCLASADLAGSMTLDAAGDANACFVFRIAGSMTASNDASIDMANGARSSSAYFVVGDKLSIGERVRIEANLLSYGDISISRGSEVHGRVLSVKGAVNIADSIVAAGTGYIEVCKQLVAGDAIPDGTLFTFSVAGIDHEAPAGGCTSPILVTAGNVTVVEAARDNTAVAGIAAAPASRLVSRSLALRTAVVSVPEGEANSQTVVWFTNQTTKTGVIEICKYGSDTDVTGYFQFTAQGAPGQTFAVPVGFCSPTITLTIPQAGTDPFTANVTELARESYRLTDVGAFPTSQAISLTPNAGFDVNGVPLFSNTDGGYATVDLKEGGAASMVVVNFYNRSLPGVVKVCKITADQANIPVNTLFTFQVSGTIPTSPTQITPGIGDTTTVQVRAGSVAQNGFCAFVPNRTYVVGTPITVTEIGAAAPVNFAEVRVSRIRSLTGTVSTSLVNKTATVMARNTTAEVEFTNFIFRPAVLKICKMGATLDVTGNFSFTMAPVDPLTTWNVSTAATTVPVGACTFLSGPFNPIAGLPGIGTFNLGTRLNVTEGASGTTILQNVWSTTGNPVAFTAGSRSGTITLDQPASTGNMNEIAFTNALPAPPPASARLDFDGDGKSDMVIFRNGTWWYGASSLNNGQSAIQFGSTNDKLVPADYDGDGKTDAAVYRNGTWFILGSTAGFSSLNFGLPTDIPQVGDFDGDGKADMVVYRPSDGVWYMMRSTAGFGAVQFGISSDRPVAADFDGDGRVDPAVYRDGTWYILGSTNGFSAYQFGLAGDIPVQADFDGDHKADPAVYRNGWWHILGSVRGYYAYKYGLATDTPVPADYDGDGRADFAVYRTSTNVWHFVKSSLESTTALPFVEAEFGTAGDVLMNY